MYVFLGVVFLIVLLICFFVILPSKKMRNIYPLVLMMGKKGCGKSTTIAKLVTRHIKNGWTCYSTSYCSGCFKVSPDQVGRVELPDINNNGKTVLFVDEINLLWDNRDFKSFPAYMKEWLIQMRKHHVKCYMFSQTYTCDKKIRDLADEIYLLSKVANVFTYGKKVKKFLTIRNSEMSENGSDITEGMEFEKFFVPRSRFITYIPKYVKMFNTDEINHPLEKVDFQLWDSFGAEEN